MPIQLCSPAHGDGSEFSDDIDDEVREEDALFDEPIVGKMPKTPTSGVKGLPTPREMTPAQFRERCIPHLPHHEGCPYCTAGRRCNSHHRSLPSTPALHTTDDGRLWLPQSQRRIGDIISWYDDPSLEDILRTALQHKGA